MSITSIGSYVTTGQEFDSHFSLVEEQIGVGVIKLQGGYTLAGFKTDFANVKISISGIAGSIVNLGILRGQLEIAKTAIRERARQFRGIASGQLSGTAFASEIEALPIFGAIESRFMEPLEAALGLWERVAKPVAQGGLALDIVLPVGYEFTEFRADITALRALYAAESTGTLELTNALKQRDFLLKPFYERMKQYRQVIVGSLPQGDPLLGSVPRLTPRPGTTPKPVTDLAGGWDAVLGKAKVTFTPSIDPKVTRLSARICLSKKWKEGEEVVIGTIPLGVAVFEFLQGLEAPGSVICLKIFAIGEDDNESGGKALVIVRPVV